MAKQLIRPLHVIAILVLLMAQIGVISVSAADRTFAVDSTDDMGDLDWEDGVCFTD